MKISVTFDGAQSELKSSVYPMDTPDSVRHALTDVLHLRIVNMRCANQQLLISFNKDV